MAHPKRRHSSTRRDKRRTHYKAELPTLSKCPATGTIHQRHRAYWLDGKLYYRGQVVMEKAVKASAAAAE
jgi:large subunit ribosomal protein L32